MNKNIQHIEEMIKLGEAVEKLQEENCPTDPSKWSYYTSQAKEKFEIYPSAYANAWASKQYGDAGGGWKKCPKKESVNENVVDKLRNAVQKINRKYQVKVSTHPVTKGEIEIILGRGNHSDDVYHSIEKLVSKLGIKRGEYSIFDESVNEGKEPEVISQLRDIVKGKQNKKIKDPKSGKMMRVDLYSASAVTQVYDALKQQKNKDKFVGLGLVGMVNMAFKLLKKESVNESDVKKKINRRGDVDGLVVTHKGNDYEIVYSGDFSMGGAIQPYGIVMPGDDVVSFLSKDKKAKAIWKQLKPKVDKFLKSKKESVNEKYTGNPGDKLTHKYDKNTEIELIEPTNRGWKVYQITKGKRKIAYFDKQDIVGDKALFESVNEGYEVIRKDNKKVYISDKAYKRLNIGKDVVGYSYSPSGHDETWVMANDVKSIKPSNDKLAKVADKYAKFESVNEEDTYTVMTRRDIEKAKGLSFSKAKAMVRKNNGWRMVKESVNEEKVYIDYLNKKKGFKPDRIKFNSYKDAVKWAKKNFEKFNPDMIHYESVTEDENDPQEIKVGNYQTKYFHVCPGASTLYKDIESKGVDMDMAERSARLQDALFFIEEHIQRDGYDPEKDYVMVAKNIAKNIMKLAKMMGLEEEHNYIQGHIDTIEKVVNGDSVNEGNAFTGALFKARKEGLTEFEFNGKKYPVHKLEEEEVIEEGVQSKHKLVREGVMSNIDMLAGESDTFIDFMKSFKKEYPEFDYKNRDLVKWLQSTYKSKRG